MGYLYRLSVWLGDCFYCEYGYSWVPLCNIAFVSALGSPKMERSKFPLHWGNSWEKGWSAYGLSWAHRYHLDLNWAWNNGQNVRIASHDATGDRDFYLPSFYLTDSFNYLLSNLPTFRSICPSRRLSVCKLVSPCKTYLSICSSFRLSVCKLVSPCTAPSPLSYMDLL